MRQQSSERHSKPPQTIITPHEVGRDLENNTELEFDLNKEVTPKVWEWMIKNLGKRVHTYQESPMDGFYLSQLFPDKREEIPQLTKEQLNTQIDEDLRALQAGETTAFTSFLKVMGRLLCLREFYNVKRIDVQSQVLSTSLEVMKDDGGFTKSSILLRCLMLDPIKYLELVPHYLTEQDRKKFAGVLSMELFYALMTSSPIDQISDIKTRRKVLLSELETQRLSSSSHVVMYYIENLLLASIAFSDHAYIDVEGKIVIVPKQKKIVASHPPLLKTQE